MATHPVSGYALPVVHPDGETRARLSSAREAAQRLDIQLSFHPDQFVVLNSERDDVVASSVRELDLQGVAPGDRAAETGRAGAMGVLCRGPAPDAKLATFRRYI